MTLHRPDLRWQIDWADNSYRSPHADITNRLHSWEVRYGAQTDGNPTATTPSIARGKLTLDNIARELDPDSKTAVLDEKVLRARHKVRLIADGGTLWSGIAVPANRGDLVAGDVINWRLTSLHDERLRSLVTISLNTSSTVAGVASAFSEETGIPLEITGGTQPTGQVYFYGNTLDFLDDLGLFAGGWVIEDEVGAQHFRYWAGNHPLAASFDLNNRPLARLSGFAERSAHLRNYANCRAFFWFPVRADDGTNAEVVLASTIVQLTSGELANVDLEFTSRANRRPIRWTRAGAQAGEGQVSLSNYVQTGEFTSRVTVRAPTFNGPPRLYEILGYGHAEERREVKPFPITATLFDTQEIFGRRELLIPPWFPPSFDGVADFTALWLRNLSQPPEHVRVGYQLWQPTAAASRSVMFDAQPGNRVQVALPITDDTTKTFDLLVLGTKLSGGLGRAPIREFTGVTRRTFPPEPLQAYRTTSLSDTSAQVEVDVVDPVRNSQIFFRSRTA